MSENRIILTSEQENAVARIHASINDKSVRTVTLHGPAGSGKTTTLGTAVKAMGPLKRYSSLGGENNGFMVDVLKCCALTHRACAQFKASLAREGIDLEVVTLHSLLKVTMERDPKTGLLRNNRDQEFRLDPAMKGVLVDEASMAPNWMLRRLLSGMDSGQTLVGIGDEHQLAPVGDSAMNMLFTNPDVEIGLTAVQRHGGSILRLCERVRRVGVPNPDHLISATSDESSVSIAPGYRFKRELETALRVASRKGTTDRLRILAYSNKCVDSWAWWARKVVFNLDERTDPWIPGERLTNVDTLVDTDDGTVLLPPSSELAMVNAGRKQQMADQKLLLGAFEPFSYQECEFREVNTGESYWANVVCPEDVKRFKDEQKRMRDWVQDPKNRNDEELSLVGNCYSDRTMLFCQLQPQFATTIHKSQGSTFDQIFLDLGDPLFLHKKNILDDETFDRLFYVAASRASQRLVIEDSRPRT